MTLVGEKRRQAGRLFQSSAARLYSAFLPHLVEHHGTATVPEARPLVRQEETEGEDGILVTHCAEVVEGEATS